jgi:hypothetical protein
MAQDILKRLKANRVKVGKGEPHDSEGYSGDFTLRQTTSGVILYVKYVDKWYRVGRLKSVAGRGEGRIEGRHKVTTNEAIIKGAGKNMSITSNEIDVDKGNLTLDVAGDIILNADGGDVTIADGIADDVWKIDAANRSFRFQHDDANYFRIDVDANGVTTMSTTDEGVGTSGDFNLNVEGICTVTAFTSLELATTIGGIELDAKTDIILDADGDQVTMKFGGATGQIDFSNENSGDGVIRQMIDAKDLVIQQFDGTEVARFTDGADFRVANNAHFDAQIHQDHTSGGITVDWNTGNKQSVDVTGTGYTLTMTNPAGPCNLILKVIQGDGSDTITTWAASSGSVYWAGGAIPTLSTGNGEIDIVSFYFDGTNYFAVASLDFATV